MAFSVNYWQITASHVQQPAQRPKATKPEGTVPSAPKAPPVLADLQEPTANERHDALPFRPIYHDKQQPVSNEIPAPAPSGGKTGGYTPTMADKVVRMMQASPNLTLEQVKAILKIDSFD